MGAPRIDWQAEKRVAKKRARVLTMTKPEEVSVGVWLSAYLELFPSERSVKAEREHLSTLRTFRNAHGKLPVCEVTPLLAQSWAMEHPGQVRHLSRAWNKAVIMGVANVNVWRLVTLPKRTAERVRPPTELELRGILDRCHERGEWWDTFADMIEVAAYSGAREGGLIALRRSAVDLSARRMVLTEKGDKTRTVALCGPARDAMERRVADALPLLPRPARWLVFRNRKRSALSAWTVQDAWREVRGDFPHGFHSLKHFAGTWLYEQGVSRDDVAIQLGHTDALGRPQPRLGQRVYVHPDHEPALQRIEAAV